jgi:hypothetical protein
MGIVPTIVWIGLHFSCVAIDMALVLMFFRLVGQWRRTGWIATVNQAAQGIVDPLAAVIGLRWQALANVRLSPRGRLAASMATLALARLALQGFAGLLT